MAEPGAGGDLFAGGSSDYFCEGGGDGVSDDSGYNVVKRAEKVDWQKRLMDLENPHEAFERLHGRSESSYGFDEHVQNLRMLSVVEGKSEPKPKDVYHAVIMVAYNEGLETLIPSVEAVRDTSFPNERIIFVLGYEERGGEAMEANAMVLKEQFRECFGILFW